MHAPSVALHLPTDISVEVSRCHCCRRLGRRRCHRRRRRQTHSVASRLSTLDKYCPVFSSCVFILLEVVAISTMVTTFHRFSFLSFALGSPFASSL